MTFSGVHRRTTAGTSGGLRRALGVLELRQRYSLLNIADRLYELAERRLDMGSEAFVHEHYEHVLQLMRWLEIDRFDRRAVNRRLAELAVAAVMSAAS